MANQTYMFKNVKCVYPTLADPRGFNEDDDKKYSITLLIPKDDKTLLAEFSKWIKDCVNGTTWKKADKDHVIKTAINYDNGFNKYCVLKDGDIINDKRVEDDKNEYSFYTGSIVVKPTKNENKGRPLIVDQKNNSITISDIAGTITSGDIVNVQVFGSCYDFQGSKGFSLKLNAVQLVAEGEDPTNHNPFDELDIPESEEVTSGSDETPFD